MRGIGRRTPRRMVNRFCSRTIHSDKLRARTTCKAMLLCVRNRPQHEGMHPYPKEPRVVPCTQLPYHGAKAISAAGSLQQPCSHLQRLIARFPLSRVKPTFRLPRSGSRFDHEQTLEVNRGWENRAMWLRWCTRVASRTRDRLSAPQTNYPIHATRGLLKPLSMQPSPRREATAGHDTSWQWGVPLTTEPLDFAITNVPTWASALSTL
jgi:hypothetical protein